jgi:predicted nucleic acid-binding protein
VDLGEAEAIALFDQVGADILLIDDAAGRHVARQLNIPVAGVLGLLLRLKRQGLIERVSGYVTQLVDGSFYLSAQAVATVLAEAGEG